MVGIFVWEFEGIVEFDSIVYYIFMSGEYMF